MTGAVSNKHLLGSLVAGVFWFLLLLKPLVAAHSARGKGNVIMQKKKNPYLSFYESSTAAPPSHAQIERKSSSKPVNQEPVRGVVKQPEAAQQPRHNVR